MRDLIVEAWRSGASIGVGYPVVIPKDAEATKQAEWNNIAGKD